MFNVLYNDLPKTVIINNHEYPINYTAKTLIEITSLLEKQAYNEETEQEQLANILLLFYPKVPQDLQSAIIEFYNFYGGYSNTKMPQDKKRNANIEKKFFSFKHDANLILAAFSQQYGVLNINNLHWYEFMALFNGLTEKCKFIQVIQYRTMKISDKMSKEEKTFYRKMKRLYALPDERTEQEKEQDFASMLWNL